jgi:methyl-galactoside transport system substrate-binding protein
MALFAVRFEKGDYPVMKRKWSVALCLVIVALSFSFAVQVFAAESKKLTFGVLVFEYANDYMFHVRTGMRRLAQEYNIELIEVDAQSNQSQQIDQCDTLIGKGVDGILGNLVDPEAGITIIEKCKAAGIPVCFVNRKPLVEDVATYDRAWYVGAAMGQPGEVQANQALEYWKQHPDMDKNGDGVIQYLLIKGENGHANAEARCKEIERVFNENMSVRPTKMLEMQVGMWNTQKGKEVMEAWIGKYGNDIELVLSNNDAMALGAIEALKADGYFIGDKFVPIFGVNAIPEGLDAIEQGTMVGSVLSDMPSEGWVTARIVYNNLTGKDVMDGIPYEMDETKTVPIYGIGIEKANVQDARAIYK